MRVLRGMSCLDPWSTHVLCAGGMALSQRTFVIISPLSEVTGKSIVAKDLKEAVVRECQLLSCEIPGTAGASKPDLNQGGVVPESIKMTLSPMFKDNLTVWLPMSHSHNSRCTPADLPISSRDWALALRIWLTVARCRTPDRCP